MNLLIFFYFFLHYCIITNMSNINILSPHIADMIAAGEVVERPASVIKELVENSFDAHAHNIVIEIRNGGMTYIRVSDDGCGMSPEDAGIAFIRHATSKLHDEHGLDSIATMGFRGEALAAISSVSNMEIITREKTSPIGTKLTLSAGEIDEMDQYGCPEGTTVIVKDLFFNTPARLKFMKTDRSESSACISAALKCALGRPDVSVKFIRDGREEFFSPGDGKTDSCIYSLLGRDIANSMLPITSSSDNLKLCGFISSPSEGRGNRSNQFFFVNGRCIKSLLLQSALEQAYKDTLLVGKYPSCVFYLDIPYSAVDVNVHPAKTEVRFVNERQIFDFIYTSCKFALNSEDRLLIADIPEPQKSVPPKPDAEPDNNSTIIPAMPIKVENDRIFEPVSKPIICDNIVTEYSVQNLNNIPSVPEFTVNKPIEQPVFDGFEYFAQNTQKVASTEPFLTVEEKIVENSVANVEKSTIPHHNILGQAFKTYIIVEHNGEILLIDKHAAHERMVFDRLCDNIGEISSQSLISQTTLRLSPEDSEIIESNGELLYELGFEIEPYGENAFIVRAIPSDLSLSEIVPAIDEICDKLKSGKAIDINERKREILHTVACKAAIKAGWSTEDEELQVLVDAVISGKVKYCPHGRPVSVVVTRKDLDKLFKRIV